MSSDVRDVDALRQLHAAIVQLSESCDDYAVQLRQLAYRFQEQVQTNRRQYWQQQLQLAERKLQAAHESLARARISHDAADGTRNTVAEILVAKANRRVACCVDKLRLCKNLAAETDRVVDRVVGQLGAISELAQSGLPRSADRLAKWIDALDVYTDSAD